MVLNVQMKRTCGEIQQSTIITSPFAKGDQLFSPLCISAVASLRLFAYLLMCLFAVYLQNDCVLFFSYHIENLVHFEMFAYNTIFYFHS